MSEYILYLLMGIVILLIIFVLLRLILQLVFIRECPKCGRTVSLAKSKECPKCGYDFKEGRDPKFHATVALFVVAILGIGAFDVYSFKNKTEEYEAANPYMSVVNITKEAEEAAEEEAVTEMGTEVVPENSEQTAEEPEQAVQDQAQVTQELEQAAEEPAQ